MCVNIKYINCLQNFILTNQYHNVIIEVSYEFFFFFIDKKLIIGSFNQIVYIINVE